MLTLAMQPDALVAALSRPAAYPHAATTVEVIHTHGSVVFLVGEHVYKFKRPVDLGFLDYSSFERRVAMCEAEVELNRRLAPAVYHGVVMLRDGPQGPWLGDTGAPLEPAVHMRRLPDDVTMAHRVATDTLTRGDIVRVAEVLRRFHATARRGPDVRAWAEPEPVERNAADNFAALRERPELCPPALLERLAIVDAERWHALRDCVARRAPLACEGHGDLRLEHVYLMPPDGEPWVVDCVEFDLRLRAVDPVCDLAFLAMDLQCHGAWWAAEQLWQASLDDDDRDARALVPSYVAYRSLVRAKVRGLQLDGARDPQTRASLATLVRAHLLQAAAVLLPPPERPSLVLVAGLPGTGKSVLAHGLEQHAGYTWLRADAIRKELAGLDPTVSAHTDVRAGIYTPAWNDRTYDACLQRARAVLEQGGRAVVDASFKQEHRRLAFVDLARELGVPVRLLVCEADPEAVRHRLAARHDDASDADWSIYEHIRATWEPYGPRCAAIAFAVDTSAAPAESLAAALALL